jgi:hypothetical protein
VSGLAWMIGLLWPGLENDKARSGRRVMVRSFARLAQLNLDLSTVYM